MISLFFKYFDYSSYDEDSLEAKYLDDEIAEEEPLSQYSDDSNYFSNFRTLFTISIYFIV